MNPKRGEVWLVNLDPTLGAEIKKIRPLIVVSSDFIGKLPLKLVVIKKTCLSVEFILDLLAQSWS